MHKFNLFLALLVGAGLSAVAPTADAAAPYGGCDEAWRYVKSDGADWCRAHGWTVRDRVFVDNHGRVGEIVLPPCRYEDGSGQRDNCVWVGEESPNGRGASYWIQQRARTAGKPVDQWLHYVWTKDPSVLNGRWVTKAEDAALDERYWPSDWNDCYVKPSTVRADTFCPNGDRVASTTR